MRERQQESFERIVLRVLVIWFEIYDIYLVLAISHISYSISHIPYPISVCLIHDIFDLLFFLPYLRSILSHLISRLPRKETKTKSIVRAPKSLFPATYQGVVIVDRLASNQQTYRVDAKDYLRQGLLANPVPAYLHVAVFPVPHLRANRELRRAFQLIELIKHSLFRSSPVTLPGFEQRLAAGFALWIKLPYPQTAGILFVSTTTQESIRKVQRKIFRLLLLHLPLTQDVT